jgi:heptosyltransferase-2
LLFAVIDFVGGLLFGVFRALGVVFRREAPRELHARGTRNVDAGDPRTILLVQLDHLGDAVISTVMLPLLRGRYPQASIEVLAAPWNRELFEAVPEVDRVHVSRSNRFARRGRIGWIAATFLWGLRLRRRKVDLGIDARGEFPLALILWLSGARRRVGWASGGGGFLLTDRADFVPHRPEVESRLALLAELGIHPNPSADVPQPKFRPPEGARRRIAQRLAAWDFQRPADGPRVVLHVGAGTPAKQWPGEHWRELIGRLIVRLGARIVLVGGDDAKKTARAILGRQPWPNVHDETGRLTIVELAALLERAEVVVGADSGPAHLAAAVGTPVVVLFSGTNHAGQWQPGGARVSVLRHSVACSPCHRERCVLDEHPCMRGLSPQQVAAAVERVSVASRRLPTAAMDGATNRSDFTGRREAADDRPTQDNRQGSTQ